MIVRNSNDCGGYDNEKDKKVTNNTRVASESEYVFLLIDNKTKASIAIRYYLNI